MKLVPISKLFHFEKGTLQSSKCTPGEYNFITASAEWKTHNEYTFDCEALIFAAAASGSLGRTHYVNGKFISSDLCFILTPKNEDKYPIDLQFYHIIFNVLKDDIVKNTKAGTSKEAIGLTSFGNYHLPYFAIEHQLQVKSKFITAKSFKEDVNSEQSYQLDLIKKMRQQILKDAMHGKLVPQNPEDEPASKLFEKIKAEKGQSGRKENSLPEIKPEEIPFDIPENWAWCRLGDVAIRSEAGKSYSAIEVSANENEWAVIKTSAITSGIFLESENKLLPNQNLDYSKIKINVGDILFCRASGSKGLAGKSCIVEVEPGAKLIMSDKSIRFVFSKYVSNKFIQLYNASSLSIDYYNGLRTGKSTSMNNITREQFNNLPVPMPPFPEQQRIVSKIEELMALCDELEANVKANQAYTNLLYQTALKEALSVGQEVLQSKTIEQDSSLVII